MEDNKKWRRWQTLVLVFSFQFQFLVFSFSFSSSTHLSILQPGLRFIVLFSSRVFNGKLPIKDQFIIILRLQNLDPRLQLPKQMSQEEVKLTFVGYFDPLDQKLLLCMY